MAKVNLITRTAAEEIAASYFKNENVHSLFVTRDGQVFYADKKHYMRMHERSNKLDPSWYFERGAEIVSAKKIDKVEPEAKKEEIVEQEKEKEPTMSFASLKKHFQQLTDEGKIEKEEWESLKFAQLRKKYEEINKD